MPSILPPPDIFKFTPPSNPPVLLEESAVNDRLEKRKEKFGFDVPVSAYITKKEPHPSFVPLFDEAKKEDKGKVVEKPAPLSTNSDEGAKEEENPDKM